MVCLFACFAARYSVHGSCPQTDSVPSADLHYHRLSGGAHPRRLPEYCQLLQVMASSPFFFLQRKKPRQSVCVYLTCVCVAVVSFTAWFFYAITLSGLIYLKIKKPELPRPYRVSHIQYSTRLFLYKTA